VSAEVSAGQGERRAWGWVHHLRDGGTTPWSAWIDPGTPLAPVVPGAQQLELLRRLNLTGPVSPVLVDRVLEASAVGRGQPDLELVGAVEETPFGPRPVDPSDVPLGELLRVATAVLTEDVVAAGLPQRRRSPRARPWRTRYRLVGDPELVGPVRAEMVARGRPPGGRDARVVVLGADLGRLLADAWTARCFDLGARSWRAWVRRIEEHDRLPGRTDVAMVAAHWARKVGRDRVHVVLDPGALPDLLGVRHPIELPVAPAAEVPDLGRRIAGVLGLHVPADERTALLRRTLRPWLEDAPGLPLGVPAEQLDWVRAHAERIGRRIRDAGYAVHGEPDALQPGGRVTVEAPSDAATLDLALRMMLTGTPRTTSEEVE
jgi:hypothetical protein